MTKKPLWSSICLMFAAAMLSGCSNSPTAATITPTLSPSAVTVPVGAATSAAVAGKTLTLATYLYRNFQPGPGQNSSTLFASVMVQAVDGSSVPLSVSADAMWLVDGSDVWVPASVTQVGFAPNASSYQVNAANGPAWDTSSTVDVIIRLNDGNGNTIFLHASAQPIHTVT